MKRLRIILWLLVGLAALAAGGLFLTRSHQSSQNVQGPDAIGLGIGGPFTLIGGDGHPFASTRLNGKAHAIFFGFTHCPDVCPTTLARLVRLRRELASKDDAFTIVFITVDPERDGPAEVASYARLFNAPVIGLTGSPAQIAQVKKQFGIFSQRVPDKSGGYSVDHSAAVLLFGKTGRFQSTIAPDEADSVALDKLKRVTGNS
ncbi:MAG: SCO family protein [Sphingomicrobium sp.]